MTAPDRDGRGDDSDQRDVRHRRPPRGDGDGWVRCALDHEHWGLHGAAGLLLHRAGANAVREVLLQHRAGWSHHGGTWGLLGGARHSDEDAVQAALREAAEESGLEGAGVRVDGEYDDDHGGWSYATVVAQPTGPVTTTALSEETVAMAWWPVKGLAAAVPLHPGFAASWPSLREGLAPPHLVVDAANVIGSRPDGWWRDRAGAAERLVARCTDLARRGVAGSELEAALPGQVLHRVWPRLTVVVEGAARAAELDDVAGAPGVGAVGAVGARVRVVRAPGSGDDALVEQVAAVSAESAGVVLVVTADRGLRGRCEPLGATVAGPRWLLNLFDR